MLQKTKLVTDRSGWAIVRVPSEHPRNVYDCTDEHLYWTEDNGGTWREMTPPEMAGRSILDAFFLQGMLGWVIATDAASESNSSHSYLFTTADGGKTWRTLRLPSSDYGLNEEAIPKQVFFCDPKHGWMAWRWAVTHSRLFALLATEDGGRTWKPLAKPPGAGPLQFVSPQEGWMVGGPESPGIPNPEHDTLWVTHDGGQHWQSVQIPLPAGDEADRHIFTAIGFKSASEGAVAAEMQLTNEATRFFSCETHDGGKSWSVTQFEAETANPSIVDSHIIWSFSAARGENTKFRIRNQVVSPSLPSGLSAKAYPVPLDFINDSHGWASSSGELLSTVDGARTFQVITPPVVAQFPYRPLPEIFAVNGRVLRFPTAHVPFAIQYPAPGRNERLGPLFAPAAGGPMEIKGRGFLEQNAVWFGERAVEARRTDEAHVRLLVPRDLPPGDYELRIETANGKSEPVRVTIRAGEELKFLGFVRPAGSACCTPRVHPGDQVTASGRGLLLENTVWFGSQPVATELKIANVPLLRLNVPASLAPGSYDVYIMNANGKSNVLSVIVE